LRKTRGPAALIECGYLSNTIERRICVSDRFQSQLSKNIANGIAKFIRRR